MTRTKKLSDRAVKISISLDRELVNYLDELPGDRSGNITRAIEYFRSKQRQIFYARVVRAKFEQEIDRLI